MAAGINKDNYLYQVWMPGMGNVKFQFQTGWELDRFVMQYLPSVMAALRVERHSDIRIRIVPLYKIDKRRGKPAKFKLPKVKNAGKNR